jgi:hypothetical protein
MINYLDIKGFLDLTIGYGLSPEEKEKLHEEFYEELYDEILSDWHKIYIHKINEKVEIFKKKRSWDDI